MNVLSLFDGISCGRVALDRAGINVKNYYASEIDRHAIAVSNDNHQDIVQIGDVRSVKYEKGVLYSEKGSWNVGVIDLLIGGSPCQSFSALAAISNNQSCLKGKSGLFYEYLRVLKEIQKDNPGVKFLLENVRMKNSSKFELDRYLGVEGVYINSELVSFQKRPRFYWANWEFTAPTDLDIDFQDYKESGDLSEYKVNRTPSRERMWNDGNGRNPSLGGCANITNSKKIYCLTTKQDRMPNSGLIEYEDFCRYLTRSEMEQAQNLPVDYTRVVSYNQAQAVLGNGWTVDVIAGILETINTPKITQERLFA